MDAQDTKNNASVNKENEPSTGGKGNEDKKIFVGGIGYDTTNDDLQTHFSKFGEVAQAQVKFDRFTGRSRGFAFVEFANSDSCKEALASREQTIKSKTVEVKPAKSRENKKVFVGGLPADYDETQLRAHFEAYGKVEDIEWPFDKTNKQRRNFAFIVFEEEEAADRASVIPKQSFGPRECDVKKAVPQGRRFTAPGMTRGNMRGGYGMGRGGAAGWYGAWGGMGGPAAMYGGAAAAWGDWYSNPAGYYGGHGAQNGYAGYGGAQYGQQTARATNGYDAYPQGAAANRQNGVSNGQPRFQQTAQPQQY